jgi:hypothetical protein
LAEGWLEFQPCNSQWIRTQALFLGGGPKDPRMGYTKKPSPWVKTFPRVHAPIFIFIFILFLKVNLLASTLYIQEFKFF